LHSFHKLVLTLLKASWRRSLAMVQQRRSAIAAVAEEMLAAEDEKLSGQRLVEIIEVSHAVCCVGVEGGMGAAMRRGQGGTVVDRTAPDGAH
jgi:cell division protease FtsH